MEIRGSIVHIFDSMLKWKYQIRGIKEGLCMEYERKMTEAEKGRLKENIINMVKGIDEEKFLKQMHTILKRHIEKRGD